MGGDKQRHSDWPNEKHVWYRLASYERKGSFGRGIIYHTNPGEQEWKFTATLSGKNEIDVSQMGMVIRNGQLSLVSYNLIICYTHFKVFSVYFFCTDVRIWTILKRYGTLTISGVPKLPQWKMMLDYEDFDDYSDSPYVREQDVTPSYSKNQSDVNRTVSSHFGRDEKLAQIEIAVQAIIFTLALIGNTCVLAALRYIQHLPQCL